MYRLGNCFSRLQGFCFCCRQSRQILPLCRHLVVTGGVGVNIQRGLDIGVLFVSSDVPTVVRYIIASPMTSAIQKTFAENALRKFIRADSSVSALQETPFEEGDRVLYCFGQEE